MIEAVVLRRNDQRLTNLDVVMFPTPENVRERRHLIEDYLGLRVESGEIVISRLVELSGGEINFIQDNSPLDLRI